MKKRITSIVMALLLCLSLVPTAAFAADSTAAPQPATLTQDKYDINSDGTKDPVYEIENANQLYWFAGLVNGTLEDTERNSSANAVLTADITVNKNVLNADGALASEGENFLVWTPIGDSQYTDLTVDASMSATPFGGFFDGQGHTISGLYCVNTAKNDIALFGVTTETAVIQNLTLRDTYFNGFARTAGINARGAAKVIGCENHGTIISANKTAGGICGWSTATGEITGCANSGFVTGLRFTGGICGFSDGSLDNCTNSGSIENSKPTGNVENGRTGGVCGYINKTGSLDNCTNSGKVTGTSYIGGICGYNYGTIQGTVNTSNTGSVSGTSYVGGICGHNVRGDVINCTNSGSIENIKSETSSASHGRTGGICGCNLGNVTSCTNSGMVTGTESIGGVCGLNNYSGSIDGTENTGTVLGEYCVGGICGENSSTKNGRGTIYNSKNSGKVTGTDSYAGGLCGVSSGIVYSCTNSGEITGKLGVGGLLGHNSYGNATGALGWLYNSGSTGKVSGQEKVGGLTGGNTGVCTIENCYSIGEVVGEGELVGGLCGGSDGSVYNCYFSAADPNTAGVGGGKEDATIQVNYKSLEAFASGEVAWLLNGDQAEDEGKPAWGQEIGKDAVPVPGGKKVYQVNARRCDGEVLDTLIYSNSDSAPIPAHTWKDGICEVCQTECTEAHTPGTTCPVCGKFTAIPEYDVVVSAGENGSVTASSSLAPAGTTVTITVTPNKGYLLETISVTDESNNALQLTDLGNGMYTFVMPKGKAEVKAAFIEDTSMLNYFVDVKANDYFYDAVLWAARKGITTGTTDVTFSPNENCTRAQIVTFLWRAAGSPEPKTMKGFSDVSASDYYAKAVAWAVENEITNGTGEGLFSPNATCTRAQCVTFLHRAVGTPRGGNTTFSDVPANSYYANAVAWAVEYGVTNGIGDGLFGPENSCTRAQIVTFLYRTYEGK